MACGDIYPSVVTLMILSACTMILGLSMIIKFADEHAANFFQFFHQKRAMDIVSKTITFSNCNEKFESSLVFAYGCPLYYSNSLKMDILPDYSFSRVNELSLTRHVEFFEWDLDGEAKWVKNHSPGTPDKFNGVPSISEQDDSSISVFISSPNALITPEFVTTPELQYLVGPHSHNKGLNFDLPLERSFCSNFIEHSDIDNELSIKCRDGFQNGPLGLTLVGSISDLSFQNNINIPFMGSNATDFVVLYKPIGSQEFISELEGSQWRCLGGKKAFVGSNLNENSQSELSKLSFFDAQNANGFESTWSNYHHRIVNSMRNAGQQTETIKHMHNKLKEYFSSEDFISIPRVLKIPLHPKDVLIPLPVTFTRDIYGLAPCIGDAALYFTATTVPSRHTVSMIGVFEPSPFPGHRGKIRAANANSMLISRRMVIDRADTNEICTSHVSQSLLDHYRVTKPRFYGGSYALELSQTATYSIWVPNDDNHIDFMIEMGRKVSEGRNGESNDLKLQSIQHYSDIKYRKGNNDQSNLLRTETGDIFFKSVLPSSILVDECIEILSSASALFDYQTYHMRNEPSFQNEVKLNSKLAQLISEESTIFRTHYLKVSSKIREILSYNSREALYKFSEPAATISRAFEGEFTKTIRASIPDTLNPFFDSSSILSVETWSGCLALICILVWSPMLLVSSIRRWRQMFSLDPKCRNEEENEEERAETTVHGHFIETNKDKKNTTKVTENFMLKVEQVGRGVAAVAGEGVYFTDCLQMRINWILSIFALFIIVWHVFVGMALLSNLIESILRYPEFWFSFILCSTVIITGALVVVEVRLVKKNEVLVALPLR